MKSQGITTYELAHALIQLHTQELLRGWTPVSAKPYYQNEVLVFLLWLLLISFRVLVLVLILILVLLFAVTLSVDVVIAAALVFIVGMVLHLDDLFIIIIIIIIISGSIIINYFTPLHVEYQFMRHTTCPISHAQVQIRLQNPSRSGA